VPVPDITIGRNNLSCHAFICSYTDICGRKRSPEYAGVYCLLKWRNCSDNTNFSQHQILHSSCTGKCMSFRRKDLQTVSRKWSDGSWFVCSSNVQYNIRNLCSGLLLRWTDRWQQEVGTGRWILSTPLHKAEGCFQRSLQSTSGNTFPYGACSRTHEILDTKFVYVFLFPKRHNQI